MNINLETIKQKYNDSFESVKSLLVDIYTSAWHDGRHADRDKWSKCGYLIIDPMKKKEIEDKINNDVCKSCEKNLGIMRAMCSYAKTCKEYQERMFLLELTKYFK